MFREDRPLLSWLAFRLHFGIMLGAKFATILHFGGFRVHFSDPGGKKIELYGIGGWLAGRVGQPG